MPTTASQKFEIRLAPKEGEPDALVFDDVILLIQQAVVTASPQVEVPTVYGEFVKPDATELIALLDSKIKHRIEQASTESRKLAEARAAKSSQPDSESQLAQESLDAASNVISAVQRAMIRGIHVSIPTSPHDSATVEE